MAETPVRTVCMGKVKQPDQPKAPVIGKRQRSYNQLATTIKAYVTANPSMCSEDIARGVDVGISRVKLVLAKMTDSGLLSRYSEGRERGIRYLYIQTGVAVPAADPSIRDRIWEFVKENPGTLRGPIYDKVGRRSGASALCALIKDRRMRAEVWHTGTHYYAIEVSVEPCAR